MGMTPTPKPPRGRRWLRLGEVLRKGDWFHSAVQPGSHSQTLFPLERVPLACRYSRKLKTKTRK